MSQREKAYNRIRNEITYGRLRPGDRLVEKSLCAMFKVGRTPLREALSQLQVEGYVDFIPNKGATVTRITCADMEEIYNVLANLESYATEVAAEQLNRENLRKLRSIESELKEGWAARDYNKWMERNGLFHEYLAKMSGNKLLHRLIGDLRKRVYRYRFIALTIPDSADKYIEYHDEIIEALYKKEAKLAGKAMRRHLLQVGKQLVEFMRQVPWL